MSPNRLIEKYSLMIKQCEEKLLEKNIKDGFELSIKIRLYKNFLKDLQE